MRKKKVSLNVDPSTRDLVKIIIALRKIPVYEWVDEKAQQDLVFLQNQEWLTRHLDQKLSLSIDASKPTKKPDVEFVAVMNK